MEISPTSKNQGALLIYAMTQPAHLTNFATGSDSDIGGLSQCRLGLDESSRGRFYGTLSSQVPRGGKIEKSGYAGFRNRNRPTLFGNQCWDTTVHPYLALRVRNRLAKKPIAGADKSEHADAGAGSGLRAALHASGLRDPLPAVRFMRSALAGRSCQAQSSLSTSRPTDPSRATFSSTACISTRAKDPTGRL